MAWSRWTCIFKINYRCGELSVYFEMNCYLWLRFFLGILWESMNVPEYRFVWVNVLVLCDHAWAREVERKRSHLSCLHTLWGWRTMKPPLLSEGEEEWRSDWIWIWVLFHNGMYRAVVESRDAQRKLRLFGWTWKITVNGAQYYTYVTVHIREPGRMVERPGLICIIRCAQEWRRQALVYTIRKQKRPKKSNIK